MTFDPKASKRTAAAVEQLSACGAKQLFADLVRQVWSTNVARYDPILGDTVRVIAIQSAENIVRRLMTLIREDDEWKATGIEVTVRNNSMLVTYGKLRIHFVKAPQTSRLRPDWDHDFPWDTESNVRVSAAHANDEVYQAPHLESNIAPLFSDEGLGSYGDAEDMNEFFIVWAGEISEQPLTAGWLVAPSLGRAPVLAAAALWLDEWPAKNGSVVVDAQQTPEGQPEPQVTIRLKKNIAQVSNDH